MPEQEKGSPPESFTRRLKIGGVLLDLREADPDHTDPDHADPDHPVAGMTADDLTATLLQSVWRLDADDPALAPLFSGDRSLANDTLDARLVACRLAAEWAVARQERAAAFDAEGPLELALRRLKELEADFAAANPDDWEPYVITRGKRKGVSVWKNMKTGSLRDDPPHETPKGKSKKKKKDDEGVTPPPEPTPPEPTPPEPTPPEPKPPEPTPPEPTPPEPTPPEPDVLPPEAQKPPNPYEPPDEGSKHAGLALNALVASGKAGDHELEGWRDILPAYSFKQLRYLHAELGLPDTAKAAQGGTMAKEIIDHLYDSAGKKQPQPGEDSASRNMLSLWKEAMEKGVDPGRHLRRDARKWLNNEATPDQTDYVAKELGLPLNPDKSLRMHDVLEHLQQKLSHPGEAVAEMCGLRHELADLFSGKNAPYTTVHIVTSLSKAKNDTINYLSLALGTGGGDVPARRAALLDAVAKAYENAGNTPAVKGVVAAIESAKKSGVALSPAESTSLRQQMTAMQGVELGGIRKLLGMPPPKYGVSFQENIDGILGSLQPKLGDQLQADSQSQAHVAAVAALYDGEYKAKAEKMHALQQQATDIIKLGPLDGTKPYHALVKQADDLKRELETHTEKARAKLIALMKPADPIKFEVTPDKAGAKQKQAAAAGVLFLSAITAKRDGDHDVLGKVTLKNNKSRANAVKGFAGAATVRLTNASVGTAVHEFGHVIEFHRAGTKKLAQDFLTHRGADQESPVKFKKKFPGLKYKADEYGKKDHFDRHFGDSAPAYYCGKTYQDGSTEVISMGCEALYRDPAGFCARDPEYAGFIIGMLSGRIR